jgi:hypothetical protein
MNKTNLVFYLKIYADWRLNLDLAEPVFQRGISIDRPAVVKPSAMAVAMATPIVSIQKNNVNVSADPSEAKVLFLT